MANNLVYTVGLDGSSAYATINNISSYAQKKFQTIGSGNIKNPFQTLTQGSDVFGRSLSRTNDRMLAFAASTSIVYGLGAAFKSLYTNSINVEKAMADIAVNASLTSKELNTLEKGLFSVASSAGQSFYAAADAAAEFSRQGLKTNKILEATRAALVLTQTTGMDTANSVKSLTSILNTFENSGLSYADVVNKMAAADTNFAVSSQDLAEGVRRVGSTAIDAKVGFDELLATITAIQQRTSRGGGVIGNSLKTIFTRLQREDSLGKVEALGVATKNPDGTFRDQISLLEDLAKKYDTLSDAQKSQLSEMVGGVYQINIVKSVFQDLGSGVSVYTRALETVKKAQNDAFVKSEFLAGTNISAIEKAKNAVIEFSSALGKLGGNNISKGLLNDFSSITGVITDGLSASVEDRGFGEKIGQSVVAGITGAIGGPGLALLAKALGKLSGQIFSRIGKDLAGNIYGKNNGSPAKDKLADINNFNLQVLKSLTQEAQLQKAFGKSNTELEKRIGLMQRVNASQSSGITAANSKQSKTNLAPRFTNDFGKSNSKFADRTNKQLSNILGTSSNFIQRSGAQKELEKRLSSLVKTYKTTENVSEKTGVGRILNQLGAFDNVKSGLPFNELNSPALRAISGKKGIQGEGARSVLFQREEENAQNNLASSRSSIARLEQRKEALRLKDERARNIASTKLYNESANSNSSRIPFFGKSIDQKNFEKLQSKYSNTFRDPEIGKNARSIFGSIPEEKRNQRNAALSSRVDKASIALALGGSFVGDLVGGKKGNAISSLTSDVSTGAVIGSVFGPLGTGIGAVTGAIKALSEISKNSVTSLDSFTESVRKIGSEGEAQRNAIASFSESNSKLADFSKDPNSSPENIQKAIRDRALALSNIDPKYRASLVNELDQNKINQVQDNISRDTGSKTNITTALASIAKNADENNSNIGLLFRQFLSGGTKDQGSIVKLNSEQLDASAKSLVNNIDFESLIAKSKDLKNPETGRASRAIKAAQNGDYSALIDNLQRLGSITSEDANAAQNLFAQFKGTEVTLFSNSVKDAYQNINELSASTEKVVKIQKDFAGTQVNYKKIAESVASREQLRSSVRKNSYSILGQRLESSSQLSGSNNIQNTISTAQKLLGISESRDNKNGELRTSGFDLVQKLVGEVGSGKIASSLGDSFIKDTLKGLEGNSVDIEKTLSSLEKAAGKVSTDPELISKISELNNQSKQARGDFATQNKLALDSFNTLKSIEKKTRFDDLINALVNGSAIEMAQKDFQDQSQVSEYFTPKKPEVKRSEQSIIDAARRTNNTDSLVGLIGSRLEQEKQILKDNKERVGSGGNSFLSKDQAFALNKNTFRDSNVLYANELANQGIADSQNTRTGRFAKTTLDSARDKVVLGGGTADSLKSAIDILKQGLSQLSPQDKNSKTISNVINGFSKKIEEFNSAVKLPVESLFPQRISSLTASNNGSGVANLQSAQNLIGQGNFAGARKDLVESGQKDLLNEFDKNVAELKQSLDRGLTPSFNSKANSDSGSIDKNKIADEINGKDRTDVSQSTEKLVSANELLRVAVNNLESSIRRERGVSSLSQEALGINNEISQKFAALNVAEANKREGQVTPLEQDSVNKSLPSILESISGLRNQKGIDLTQFDQQSIDYTTQAFSTGKRTKSSEEESSIFANLREDLLKLNKPDLIKNYDEVVKTREKSFTDNSKIDETIGVLKEEIRKLGESLEKKNKEIEQIRNSQSIDTGTFKESNSNVNLSINGADPTFIEAIKPGVENWIRDMIIQNNSNPKLFAANGGIKV